MKFSDVYGLETVKQKLVQNFHQNRLPHAQLFLGPEGSSNLHLALALTQLIYCSNPSESDSCGECSSCIKISKLTHPDVHFTYPSAASKEKSTKYIKQWRDIVLNQPYFSVLDWMNVIAKDENKAPNITKEETRDILSKLSLKPYEGEAKTLIIWLPEHLGKESNALLKLIEEPPQRTYFILVAHNFDELLTTITSRTQLVKIPIYSEAEITQFLSEKYHLEHKKAESIAFLSEGNLNTATSLVESVENNYSEIFRSWMLSCYKYDLQGVAKQMDIVAKLGRTQIQLFLKNGLKILRESLLYINVQDYEVKFEGEYREFVKNFSNTLNAKHIEKSYSLINESIYHIQRNANAKITLFNLSLALKDNFIRKR